MDPVVGWLVCLAGPDRGKDFRLHAEKNFIGRAPNMDVCVAGDETVSRERHAMVIFDPKTAGQSDPYTRFDLPGGAGRLYADAKGIDTVMVTGTVIVQDNTHTGELPGKVLRSGRDTYTVPIPADKARA